jgi:hypothetical protein
MKTFKEERKILREEFDGLRGGMEDVRTEFQNIRYQILPHTQTQTSTSQSITYEDKKEYKFEPNQQDVTKVINIDKAITCEITYPSTENFSDDTSRTYKIERNSTSRLQEINSETRIQESQVNELDIMKSELRELPISNSELQSQYERGKLLGANTSIYKSQITTLEEERMNYNIPIVKHEKTAIYFKDELLVPQDKLYKKEMLDVTMTIVDLTVRHKEPTEGVNQKDPDPRQLVKTSKEEINELTVSSVDETQCTVNEKDTRKVLLQTIREGYQNELKDVELDVENSGLLEDELPDAENWTYWKIRPPPKRKKESKEQDGQIQ